MSMIEAFKAEVAHETATTRKLLALVPEGRGDWKPHEKSMSLGVLAMHVAEMPMWAPNILTEPSFDIAPKDGPAYQTPPFTTREYLLQIFDAGTTAMTEALSSRSDAQLNEIWHFQAGGETMMSMPRGVALRTWVLNHVVHHRAQLGVYLRMLDVPLPGTYGPTADNPNDM